MKTIRNTSERLNAKTLDQMFINQVEYGYDCPPFVSNAILETAKSVFSPDQSNPDILNVGTILQRYKTGNKKVTDILSDQTILRFVISHFYSIFNPKIFGS